MQRIKNVLRPYYAPPKTALTAACDYYFKPATRNPYGGPLNGQAHRQAMVKEIFQLVDFDLVIETGTFCGSSTEWFATLFDGAIHTVELNPYYYYYARSRFLTHKNIHLHQANSVDYLTDLVRNRQLCLKNVFFYLDAHWNEYLPLREEIAIILENFDRCVIMIDDFQVDGDPGYGFDDYGPVGTLRMDYLSQSFHSDFAIFYPSLPSRLETGKQRGSVVITANSALQKTLKSAASLRYSGRSSERLADGAA